MKKRLGILLSLAVLAACVWAANVHPYTRTLITHLRMTLVSLLMLASAQAAGTLVLKLVNKHPLRTDDALVFGTCIGLGILSLSVLILGRVGILNSLTAWMLILGLLATGWRPMYARILKCIQHISDRQYSSAALAILAPVCILLVLAWICCLMPPLDYDVIEYHLAGPAAYFREGNIHFLDTNVFASFPQNMEMLYLLALHLEGDVLTGATVAKIFHFLMMFVLAGIVHATGRRFVGKNVGKWAALLILIVPMAFAFAIRAYITLLLGVFTAAALYALLAATEQDTQHKARLSYALLAGVMTGLAAGTKYSAFLLLAPPVFLCLAVWGGKRIPDRLKVLGVYVSALLVGVLPWLLRNAYNTGNPVYPLFQPLFSQAGAWNGALYAKFMAAHSPPGSWSPWDLIQSTSTMLAGKGYAFHPVIVPCLLLAFLWARSARRLNILAIFACIQIVLWYSFTHRIGRFLFPAYLPLALIAGGGLAQAASRNRKITALVMTLAGTWTLYVAFLILGTLNPFRVFSGSQSAEAFMLEQKGTFSYAAIQHMNHTLPDAGKALYIGEACTFYSTHPHVYATVFDVHPLEKMTKDAPSPDVLAARFKARNITHIYLNWPEIQRLTSSYAFDFEGRTHPGYLNQTAWKSLSALLWHHTQLVAHFGKKNQSERAPFEIYALGAYIGAD